MARQYSSDSRGRGQARPWNRDLVILVLFAIFIVVIACALFFVTVVKGADYSSKADAQHFKTTPQVAKRGTIYDRNGEVIASSVASYTIDVNPKNVAYSAAVENTEGMKEPAAAVAELLYEYLGSEYDHTYSDYYEMCTRENTAYVVVQRKTDKDIANQLKDALDQANLEGVNYTEDSTRVYPNGDIGAQVIGTVGLKMVDTSGNIVADDEVGDGSGLMEAYRGTSGLELEYDSLLSGKDGVVSQEKSDTGIPVAGGQIYVSAAEDGSDIVTSLDIKLQQKVEKSIKKAAKSYEAEGGSVTVMDASTGEIYAAASVSKTTDENNKTTYEPDVGKLWSVSDAYEPGSTFKCITAVNIFEKTKVTPSTTFTVPGSLQVYDHYITDSHSHGTENMTFTKIIADSSNIGTVLASRKTTSKKLYNTYHKFEFGEDPGIDFPGVATGLLEKSEDWDGVQAANVTFGQGLSVSGVQLVRAYGAIEQGGTMHVPHFLTSVPNDEENNEKYAKPLTQTKQVMKSSTRKSLVKMMRAVVTDGTGTDAAIDGMEVVGKTGTAEVAGSNGTYEEGSYIVSFCGWLEDSGCDLVCLVTLDRAKSNEGGGPVCGPVFADIMSYAADLYLAGGGD